MGKPKTNSKATKRSKNAKSNPFVVKKTTKKAKKKTALTLELVDKTFGDIQGKTCSRPRLAKKPSEKKPPQVQQDASKLERTADLITLDQLAIVDETANATV